MDEGKIKKRLDIYLYYWALIFFVAFILINYFANILKIETFDVGFMVSVVSFLFGFFISISFSMVISSISLLKQCLAEETGRLVSLFLLSKNLGEKFHNRITDIIDKYVIVTLRDYSDYNLSREEFYDIYKSLDFMELKSELQKQSASSFLYILGEFEPAREGLEYLTKGRLLKTVKFANYLLAFLLIGLLFLNRGDPLSNILFILLSTIVVFILLIIEDYENLKIGDYISNISNSEQIFDLIRKDRYYPTSILNRVKLEKGRSYRIGFYNNKTKTETIKTLTYNKSFFFNFSKLKEKFMSNSKKDSLEKIN